MCSTKATAFIITNMACSLLFISYDAFSVIKQPMAQQFHFAEEFLGTIDVMQEWPTSSVSSSSSSQGY